MERIELGNNPTTFQGWDELNLFYVIAQFTLKGTGMVSLVWLHTFQLWDWQGLNNEDEHDLLRETTP
jgi:hypothetical protein